MRAIGFRAEKDTVHYAIVEGDTEAPVLVENGKFGAPKTFALAAQLAWYRDRVQTLIAQHRADAVCVRLSETFLGRKPSPTALGSMFARCRIEGVILESASDRNIIVEAGRMQQLASKLGTRSAKKYVEAGELRGLDLGDIKNANAREAIVAGVAGLGTA